ncbi:T9SS type A sorting domain-containing protein [Paracrocinitomix mangrovi]|uniref:T9SS type A sorting domain-containing protein n=1 Tax=Paracrocinitomix mangrovi TaxID=2862509 RepID=UPI001C8E43C1|nr:T9SS type A sorting domain-containing protein [Paracrocinitomix mangrovi]UKN01084.1 T9SS type A sorting domain-containing protein [Paracrocinitomix mangrovi]
MTTTIQFRFFGLIFFMLFFKLDISAQQLSISIQNNDTINTTYAGIDDADSLYYAGYTIVNPSNNHRKMVQIFQFDTTGVLTQAFESSALDPNYSISLITMMAENDGSVLVVGEYNPNNSTPYKPVVFKLSENGSVLWAKVIDLAGIFQPKLAKLGDGTTLFTFKYNDGSQHKYFCKIDQNGSFSDFYFLNLHWLNPIKILPNSSSFDILFHEGTFANIENDFSQINWQKKYHSEIGINFSRTQNGDYIFFTTKTAFPGYMNVFRTDDSGNLIWAKYIEAWEGQIQIQTSIFDIVGINYIQENEFGNIVASANSEGGLNGSLKVEIDQNGNVLKVSKSTSYKEVFEILDDKFLIKSGLESFASVNTGDIIFEKRRIEDVFPCDIEMSYFTVESSDSLLSLDSLELTPSSMFNVLDVDLVSSAFSPLVSDGCDLTSLNSNTFDLELDDIKVYPNPVKRNIYIELSDITDINDFVVYDSQGKKIQLSYQLTEGVIVSDLSHLSNGLYVLEITLKNNELVRRKIVIQN